MEHKIIRLKSALPDDYIAEIINKNVQLTDEHYKPELLLTDYRTVLKPNGEVLLKLLPRAVNLDIVTDAFHALETVEMHDKKSSSRKAIISSANDGSEGVFGFMDRVHRFNFCRATSFTSEHLREFQTAIPFIRSTAELMKVHMPDRYAAQLAACEACHTDFLIPNTPYSTMTVNRDTSATCHTDQGDYKRGIGVIAATWAKRRGRHWEVVTENPTKGGVLVFPKYGVAVSLRTQDIVLCDVHEAHGVTFIEGEPGTWARMSFVFYLREKLNECGSQAEEIARVAAKDTAKYVASGDERPAA